MITEKEIRSLGWSRMCALGNEMVYTVYTVGRFALCVIDTHIEIAEDDGKGWNVIYKNDNLDLFGFKRAMLYLKIPINGSPDPAMTTTPIQQKHENSIRTNARDIYFDRFRNSFVKDLGNMVLECKVSMYSSLGPKWELEISSYRVGEKGLVIDDNGCPKETYCNISFVRGTDRVLEEYFLAFQKTHLL